MAKQQDQKLHPWFEMALEFGRRTGGFCVVTYGSPEWFAWAEYFYEIGFLPVTFPREEKQKCTMPAKSPALLDTPLPKFERENIPRLTAPKPEPTPRHSYVGMRANLYVGNDKPGYEAMCKRAKTADWKDWCAYKDHPKWGSGILVPLAWYQDWCGGRTSFRRPAASPHQILDRALAEKQRAPTQEAAE